MRLTEMTARLEDPKETVLAEFWVRISTLEPYRRLWLPLAGNPYVLRASLVAKGLQARKTKRGKWRFEAVEKKEWEIPEVDEDAPRLGVDVGLNVLAATSDGDLYGEAVKPKFDRLFARIKRIRANRKRQGFRENSPRLDVLESRLSGLIKTEANRIANKLKAKHPGTRFVLEDLDLKGTRGQKRFAYRALQASLERKVPTEKVNPAYTSQECPSCGYVSRRNRNGINFVCRSCGRRAHADWVGASGVLRRSGDKSITREDDPRDVKQVLRERYLRRRKDSSSGPGENLPPPANAPLPLGRRLTACGDTGKASNSMPISFA